jgi:hypothetical protein
VSRKRAKPYKIATYYSNPDVERQLAELTHELSARRGMNLSKSETLRLLIGRLHRSLVRRKG